MERRHFLKLGLGFAAGVAALAAEAAPLAPHSLAERGRLPPANEDAHPAVVTEAELDHLKPEQVGWGHHGHGHHWGWRHRHWGWRRRHWHRHYW
jgi:hypothetical protein